MSSELQTAWTSLEPNPDATERARGAVVAATPRRRRLRWPRRSRRGVVALAFALLVLAGAATAAVVRPWDQGPRASATNPTAEARILADPVLSQVSWLVPGPLGQPHISHVGPRRSVSFPAGVSYQQAITRLYTSLTERGVLPAGTTLGPPLPEGKVVRHPASTTEGIALDLQAPFGYDVPSGRVMTPVFTLPANLTPEELDRRWAEARRQNRVMPAGARLHVGPLAACQVIRPGEPSPACRLAPAPPDPWEGPPGAPHVAVPQLAGLSAGEAAQALERAGLRAFLLQVITPEQARRLEAAGSTTVPLELVRDEQAWRKAARPVVLPADESAAPGEVLDAYPAGGAEVRAGARVVVAALADDCLAERPDAMLQATCVPGAEAARDASAELRLAPWLYSEREGNRSGPFRIQAVRERPSLVFPAGVTRAEALGRLYVEAVLHGRLPAEARLAPALPRGIVYRPAAGAEGVRIDLRAPFGYDPRGGHIFALGISYRADLRADQIERQVRAGRLVELPTPLEEQVLPIPELAPCQVGGPEATGERCAALEGRP